MLRFVNFKTLKWYFWTVGLCRPEPNNHAFLMTLSRLWCYQPSWEMFFTNSSDKQNKFEIPFEVSAQYISLYWNIARSKKHWTMWVHSVRTMWAHRTRIRMLGQAHLGLFNQVSWPLVSAPLPFDTNGSVWLIWIIVSTALDVPANEICVIICLSCSGLRDKLMWTFRRRGRPITIKLHEKQFDLHWL